MQRIPRFAAASDAVAPQLQYCRGDSRYSPGFAASIGALVPARRASCASRCAM